jgi:hypothetical protein
MNCPHHILGIQSTTEPQKLMERMRDARIEFRRLEREGLFGELGASAAPEAVVSHGEAMKRELKRLLSHHGLASFVDYAGKSFTTVIVHPASLEWIACRSHTMLPHAWHNLPVTTAARLATVYHLATIFGFTTDANYEAELHARIESTLNKHYCQEGDDSLAPEE